MKLEWCHWPHPFSHEWEKWADIEAGHIGVEDYRPHKGMSAATFTKQGRFVHQSRTCLICGLTQLRSSSSNSCVS